MVYTVTFLLIMVAVSGFVAYWGDLLGRRMGKRRLTLFGMRPRYTAIVVTTITGMIIAAFTLATMLIFSSEMRELVKKGPELLAEQTALKKRNSDLRKRQKDLTRRLESTNSKMEDAIAGAEKAKSAEALAQQRSAKLEHEVTKRIRELTALEKRLRRITGELNKERRQLKAIQAEQREAKKQLANAWTISNRLWRENQRAHTGIENLINKPVIARHGEEIARVVVHPSALAEKDVRSLLKKASDVMAERGAKIGKNNRRAVEIVPWLAGSGSSSGVARARIIKEAQRIPEIARKIARSKGDVVAVVRVYANCVEGEQTLIDVSLYNNNLAFTKGQEVAGATIDGSESEGGVFLSLIQFLQRDVRSAALKADMIPKFDPDLPGFGAISGPQQFDELIDTVNRIKNAGRPVTVTAVTQEDIYAAGPMNLSNLDFVITKPGVAAWRSE
ncbi:MAG: DUF3084 domain-containing protein [Armatimonadota bacterium]|nr:DUF3084 domain-containing protein [Armatimonadota bacterium]